MSDLQLGALLGFGAGVLVSLGACLVLRRRPRAPEPQPLATRAEEPQGTPLLEQLLSKGDAAADLRQSLRVKFLYDESKVDAAIEFERQRAPQASEEELVRAAVERWERENR